MLHLIFESLIRYFVDGLVDDYLGPASKYLFGGPTKVVSTAIVGATPFLGPSILGDRVDQFVYTTAGWLIGLLVNIIATAVEQSITWSIEGFILTIHGFLIFLDAIIAKKRELPGAATLGGILSSLIRQTEGKMKTLEDGGRSLNQPLMGLSSSSTTSPFTNDVESMLTRTPELQRFLRLLSEDDDDCLKHILCSVSATPDVAKTQEEKQLLNTFRYLYERIHRTSIFYLTPFLDAQKRGQKTQSINSCHAAFQKCHFPLLSRIGFNFLQKLQNRRLKKR